MRPLLSLLLAARLLMQSAARTGLADTSGDSRVLRACSVGEQTQVLNCPAGTVIEAVDSAIFGQLAQDSNSCASPEFRPSNDCQSAANVAVQIERLCKGAPRHTLMRILHKHASACNGGWPPSAPHLKCKTVLHPFKAECVF
eukprot:SAG31_NODE_1508_length_8063_cov_3.156956_9_plen_142_part_00